VLHDHGRGLQEDLEAVRPKSTLPNNMGEEDKLSSLLESLLAVTIALNSRKYNKQWVANFRDCMYS
jgi:hypothetical protein